jgi:hypothetical protein
MQVKESSMNRIAAALPIALCLAAIGRPQDNPQPQESPTLRFLLNDGSTILGKLDIADLKVTTKYGTQVVPILDLRSFTPGLSSKPELLRRIELHIENLSSEIADDRDQAEKALANMGLPVRLELQRFSKDKDTERRTRVEKILRAFDEMEQERSEEEAAEAPAPWIREDRLETTGFAMLGEIAPKELTVKTRYGEIKLALADIAEARRVDAGAEPIHKAMSIDQADIIQKAWKSTGLKLEKDATVTVNADGSIQMTPWGGGKSSGPDGSAEYGWYDQNGKIEVGSLVGRIGKNGPVFKLGNRRTFTARASGTLYVGIAMHPNYVNYQFPGEYKLRIQVK